MVKCMSVGHVIVVVAVVAVIVVVTGVVIVSEMVPEMPVVLSKVVAHVWKAVLLAPQRYQALPPGQCRVLILVLILSLGLSSRSIHAHCQQTAASRPHCWQETAVCEHLQHYHECLSHAHDGGGDCDGSGSGFCQPGCPTHWTQTTSTIALGPLRSFRHR